MDVKIVVTNYEMIKASFRPVKNLYTDIDKYVWDSWWTRGAEFIVRQWKKQLRQGQPRQQDSLTAGQGDNERNGGERTLGGEYFKSTSALSITCINCRRYHFSLDASKHEMSISSSLITALSHFIKTLVVFLAYVIVLSASIEVSVTEGIESALPLIVQPFLCKL